MRRRIRLAAAAFCLCLALSTGCETAAYVRPLPPSLEQIVQMQKQGMPDDQVIAQIAASQGRYYMRSDAVDYLLKNGVSRAVVDFLLGTAWTPSTVLYCDDCHTSFAFGAGYVHHSHHHWH